VFPDGTTFAKRSCDVTLRYAGSAGSVKVAGEFTGWQNAPIAMTAGTGGFETTLRSGPLLEPGKTYAYKLIIDAEWKIDPAAPLRKIVGDQMNSAFRVPDCKAGPEVTSAKLTATATGDANVVVTVRSADDGAAPKKLVASLDRGSLPAGSWTTDAKTGSVAFALKGLAKGKHTLSLAAEDATGRNAQPVDLPFWVEDEAFDYSDGVLYMFMIDRFANGDTANDKPIVQNIDYDADWHGGDLQGAQKVLESGYFEKLGVRTIWLSPTNEQTSKPQQGDGNQTFSAYHGYWPTKARSVEPRFGGGQALKSFVAEAHKHGLRVLLDLINNQVHEDHEYLAQHGDWFRKSCKCGESGCGWSERPFDCMFQPYLPDINWKTQGAEDQFVADAVNWIAEYDLDGFRVDAVKHVEANSVYNMRAELTRRFEQGGARIFMVGETAVGEGDSGNFFGEYFSDGFAWIDAYTGPTALDGQFDFPTRHNMADGLVDGQKPLNEVEDQLQKSLSRYKPGNRHVRFLNGHDNPRIASIAARDGKLGCSWASGCRGDQLPPLAYDDPQVYVRLKRALTVLYSMPGVPYLYAGDEVGMGGGADPDMRRNMLWNEGLEGVAMAKPGTTKPAPTPPQIDLRAWVRKLGAARTGSKALRRGNRVTLLGNDGNLWVYGFDAGGKELAVVAINRGDAVVNRNIGTGGLATGAVAGWNSALGTGTLASSGAGFTLSLGAGEAAIFVAK
jgi:neopullulanase